MTPRQRAYYKQPFVIPASVLHAETLRQKVERQAAPVTHQPLICTLCKQAVPSEDDLYEITDQGKVWSGHTKLCLPCGRRASARAQQKGLDVGQTVFRQGKPGVVVAVSGDAISVRWPEGLLYKTYPVSRQELH